MLWAMPPKLARQPLQVLPIQTRGGSLSGLHKHRYPGYAVSCQKFMRSYVSHNCFYCLALGVFQVSAWPHMLGRGDTLLN